MAGNIKPNQNKPKFSPWILYASIVVIVLVINFLSNGSGVGDSKQLSLSKFFDYLKEGKVEKVEFNRSVAKVYLTKDALQSKDFEELQRKSILGKESTGPQFVTEIGNSEIFQKKLDEAAGEGKLLEYKSEPESEKKGTFASPATALANSVLPVPGGPTKRAPFGILPPIEVYFSGFFKNSTISTISSLAPSNPATSLKVTLMSFFSSKSFALDFPIEKICPPPPAPPPPVILLIMNNQNPMIMIIGKKLIK